MEHDKLPLGMANRMRLRMRIDSRESEPCPQLARPRGIRAPPPCTTYMDGQVYRGLKGSLLAAGQAVGGDFTCQLCYSFGRHVTERRCGKKILREEIGLVTEAHTWETTLARPGSTKGPIIQNRTGHRATALSFRPPAPPQPHHDRRGRKRGAFPEGHVPH